MFIFIFFHRMDHEEMNDLAVDEWSGSASSWFVHQLALSVSWCSRVAASRSRWSATIDGGCQFARVAMRR